MKINLYEGMIKHKIIPFLLLSITVILFGFHFNPAIKNNNSNSKIERFVIEPDSTFQNIDNFGASDGWSIQVIGLWPEEKQRQMATWLFSIENDDKGNPKGIGLSLWRFYIGAGSKEQGKESMIDNPLRRNECFLLPDGTYDWDKQKGQRNFLHQAKQQGVDQFLGFIYSAPVYWTQNGLATNLGREGTFNLKEDKYNDFAEYVADVIEGVEKKDGVSFNYISPFNEPDGHWNWDGTGQEGSAATKYEIAKTVRLISKEFEVRKLRTKILTSESSDLQCLYGLEPHINGDRGYQIQSFFSSDSTESYIGNLYNVPKLIAGHSYWTTAPLDKLKNVRMELNKVLETQNVRFWQSEVCVMSNDVEIGGGHGKDLSMKTALYMARVIHHDLVFANASAWQWWLAVGTGDYKDGLIYVDLDSNLIDGNYTDSKLMWSIGNYSRFIRPGSVRINVSAFNNSGKKVVEGDTDPNGIMLSAFKNSDNSIVAVIINYSSKDNLIGLNIPNKEIDWQPYITSDIPNFNLTKQTGVPYGEKIKIPASSIVTLVSMN